MLALKGMGDNFILFPDSDIGLIVKQKNFAKSAPGFSVSMYTVQMPIFQIEAGFANISHLCYGYVKGCQFVEFNFSYKSDSPGMGEAGQSNRTRFWEIIPFYLINNNFTGILPKYQIPLIDLDIFRDRLVMNITDLFYGLPISVYARSNENPPGLPNAHLNVTLSSQAFIDTEISITSVDLGVGCITDQSVLSPYVVINAQGNLNIVVKAACVVSKTLTVPYFFITPDMIDGQTDSEISFGWGSLQYFSGYAGTETVMISND